MVSLTFPRVYWVRRVILAQKPAVQNIYGVPLLGSPSPKFKPNSKMMSRVLRKLGIPHARTIGTRHISLLERKRQHYQTDLEKSYWHQRHKIIPAFQDKWSHKKHR
jgi:hypothetical protein